MDEKKKSFFGKLIDGIDKKLEKKSKERKGSCCGEEDNSCCK